MEILLEIFLLADSVEGTKEELDICKRTLTEFELYYKKESWDYAFDFVGVFKCNRQILTAYIWQMNDFF